MTDFILSALCKIGYVAGCTLAVVAFVYLFLVVFRMAIDGHWIS